MLLTALAILVTRPLDSGLKLGEFIPAYEPTHVAGPDAGTKTCPICKYGDLPAVQVWVNGDNDDNIRVISNRLESKVAASKHKFKAFIIVMTDPAHGITEESVKAKWGGHSKRVAFAYIPKDSDAAKNYEINTSADVKNTVFVYKDMKLKTKFVNLSAHGQSLKAFTKAITQVDR
ncbi:MAG: hypothetical protein ABUL72_05365 [Armatimonadota bacterium]